MTFAELEGRWITPTGVRMLVTYCTGYRRWRVGGGGRFFRVVGWKLCSRAETRQMIYAGHWRRES